MRVYQTRRSVLIGSSTLLLASTLRATASGPPPVAQWRPSFTQPLDRIVDRFRYYTNNKQDFAILANGTCVSVGAGLSDAAASKSTTEILTKIINFHPDMTPNRMDDGNIMVSYNQPAYSVVLADFAKAHWAEIEANHQKALTPDEVLITPLGQNVFDELGKMALLGRCYMFMDAQDTRIARVERARP